MSIRVAMILISLVMSIARAACAAEIDFNRDVRPILSDHCFQCHGPDAAQREAELRLDLQANALADLGGYAAVVPGKPEESELIDRIYAEDEEMRMPPAATKLPLTEKQREILRQWITEGAEWKDHWAFIPPSKPPLPQIELTSWPRNSIDRFVLARIEQNGFSPSAEADKERLIRRVTFDLTGLPPTLAQIDAYLADDSPDAYTRVVDRLLATDAHAERLALDWMDLARYADSHGMHSDGQRRMWPWRDWVLGALKANMPYDQFVTWQLAGDLLPDATRQQVLATAFHRNNPMTAEGGAIDEEFRLNYVFDRVETTATAFLGLTMKCCRCHDHKFDPVEQKEYYRLAAFFNNLRELGMAGDDGDFAPLFSLADAETEKQLAVVELQIAEAEAKLEQVRERAVGELKSDRLSQVDIRSISLPAGHRFRLESAAWAKVEKKAEEKQVEDAGKEQKQSEEEQHELRLDGETSAIAADMPEIVDGIDGKAMRIAGEYGYLSLKQVGLIDSTDPLTAALWVRPEPSPHEQPNSKIAKDRIRTLLGTAGNKNEYWRGWDFRLEDSNRLALRLIHNLPGDYLHVRTTARVPMQQWSHVAFVYDGSGKATGVRLFIDGRQIETEVLVDRLTRSIYPVTHAIGFPRNDEKMVRVGKSYREYTGENGIFHGTVDDLRIFDFALTSPEMAKLFDSYATTDVQAADFVTAQQHLAHALAHQHEEYQQAVGMLHRLRCEKLALLDTVPRIMVMQEMPKPRATFVLQRGDYTQPGDQVEPGTPAAVFAFSDNLPKNRLGLAQWLFLPENPLTARVAVNRYWQLIFGEGLVRTPHDFGVQGERPTHPELLDWLAVRFRNSDWDVRALIRQMVTSATYCQSSTPRPELLEIDPSNRLLARSPSYRLPAEVIRDHALSASGLLVRKLGGPSVKPYQPPGLWREKSHYSLYLLNYVPDQGEGLYRRSLYTFVRRTSPPPAMNTLDAPNRSVCTVKREITNTPLQALVLLNDPQFVEAARLLAERVQREAGESPTEQITLAFRLVVGQRPLRKQLEVLENLYANHLERFQQDKASAESLLSLGESPTDKKLDTAHTAALTIVANTLMNFDEFYMKR